MADKKEELVVPANEPLPIVEGKPVRQRTGGRALHFFLYLLTSIIFAFFLVLGGRWVYHQVHKNNEAAPASNTQNPPPLSSNQSSKSSQNKQSSQTNTNKATTPSSSSSSTTSPSPAASSSQSASQSQQIPNTGSGSVVTIFVITSAAIAGLHYALSIRRSRPL